MTFNFKNKTLVGVAVTPDLGLEVAQIDFSTRTVVKYGNKPLAYDSVRKIIADMDIFKETLQDLFSEMDIPKGANVAVTLPSIIFRVNDYRASLDSQQVIATIEEELLKDPLFQNETPCIAATKLPNSTIQFNKIAYTVLQNSMLVEMAMQIKEMGYKLLNIDTSINASLNALIYNERISIAPDMNWIMVVVENNCCRIIPMQGRNYVDCIEERVSIGEVLGDAENYETVVKAIAPVIKNTPSQCLYIVSKTNVISAEILASKLTYGAPIVHQEANNYSKAPMLELAAGVDENLAKFISLDVIGAAINPLFTEYSNAHLNLFNESLGDIYILEQPPVLEIMGQKFVLSMENMVKLAIVIGGIILIVAIIIFVIYGQRISEKQTNLNSIERQLKEINTFLEKNKNVSAEMFDEGFEIRTGLMHNKNVYSYYTIVGTEIPKKLWLTKLELGKYTTIEGQADNLESVYSFFRNIKDYNPSSKIKLQKLGLATNSNLAALAENESFDMDSIITSMNADFYEFRISDAPEVAAKDVKGKAAKKTQAASKNNGLPDLEPLE